MADEPEYKYVTLRSANFNNQYASKYGNKSPKGAVLEVPVELATQWQRIGLAKPASAEEVKGFKEWQEARFKDRDVNEEEPELMGTPAQRAAQADINIRNRPTAQRPTGPQIGNSPEKATDKDD